MKNKIIFFLILSLLSVTIAQNCGNPTPSTDLIDSGRLSLVRRGGNRQHCFTAQINYNIPNTGRSPDIAVSISRIQGYNPIGGFDYSVSAGRRALTNSIGINVQINEDVRWASLQISYLVSSNTNFVIGSFIGNLFSLTSCSGDIVNPITTLQTYVSTFRINQSLNYRVAAFVSGFRTLANSFIIRPIASDLDKVDGRLVVQIQSNSNPGVEYVYITYCLFPVTKTNSFDFSIGNTNVRSSYRFQGLVSLQNGMIVSNQFSICKIDGLNCLPGQVFINGRCECPQGFIKVNSSCFKICIENGYLNENGECVCIQGFTRNRQGFCIQGGQVPNNCNGPNEILLNNGQCFCIPGFFRNRNQCISICNGLNQTWDGRTCQCTSGFSRRAPDQPCFPQITCRLNQVLVGNSCQCISGFSRNSTANCVQNSINCRQDQVFDPSTRTCICRDGLIRMGVFCGSPLPPPSPQPPRVICPPGATVDQNNFCVCNPNLQWDSRRAACVPASCGTNASPTPQGFCACNSGFQFSFDGRNCVAIPVTIICPANSILDSQRNCNCNPGFRKSSDGQTCIALINCPQNSFINPQGTCTCNNGLYLQGNQCIPIPTCPQNSVWNQNQLLCLCTIPGQNLIGNACRSCGLNESWNGRQCGCNSGFFRISGVCRKCDINTSYNGSDCVCNLGFFGNRDKCQKCDPSCGKCSGPEANKCLSCLDISYVLSNGYCTKNSPCPSGTYLNSGSCKRCSDYCQDCISQFQCAQCAPGFKIQLTIIDGLGYSSCQPVCGDGRKVDIQQCDDGNLRNGDGCSSTCNVQQGWSCTGGTSVRASVCKNTIPRRSIIQVRGTVNMVGKVVQGVRLSYIPECFTDKLCVDCFRIIDVRVVNGSIPTQVTVGYVPNSDGQFVIQYDFGSAITSTFFTYRIQINKNLPNQYKDCFSAQDYAQQIVNNIDTALLALNDRTKNLSLDDLSNDNNPSPNPADQNSLNQLNSNSNTTVLGYSMNIINILFN